jgi:transcription elongation factor Elf1
MEALMALFRRKKQQPSSAAGAVGARPWIDHGLADGDTVSCGCCGRELRVKLKSQVGIMVAVEGVFDGIAMICTRCGRLLCEPCAAAASDERHMLKCDRCHGDVVTTMSP